MKYIFLIVLLVAVIIIAGCIQLGSVNSEVSPTICTYYKCNGICYKETEVCCGDTIYSQNSGQCCGGKWYPSNTKGSCCRIWDSKKREYTGGIWYNLSTQACCSGLVYDTEKQSCCMTIDSNNYMIHIVKEKDSCCEGKYTEGYNCEPGSGDLTTINRRGGSLCHSTANGIQCDPTMSTYRPTIDPYRPTMVPPPTLRIGY